MSAQDVKQMFLSQLKCYLDKHKMREAVELFRNDQMKQLIVTDFDIVWDLIPLVCNRLRGLNEFRFKTFNTCEQLLLEVSVLCKPKEVLIAFLAELENDTIGGSGGDSGSGGATNDDYHQQLCDHNVFKAILKPLECVLVQLPTKRNETLKWVLSTLNSHITRLSTATIDDYQFDGQEKQFIDNDINAKQINSVLPLYISFLATFVNEVDVTKQSTTTTTQTTGTMTDSQTITTTTANCNSKTSDPHIQRNILLKALLRLLDHPLLHLDLTDETQGESRELAINVVQLISRLQSNYYMLFERLDLISNNKSGSSSDSSDIELTKETFISSMANLSYLVHCETCCAINFLPTVYTHVYVFEIHLQFIDHLLRSDVSLIYEKGLLLAQQLLSQINDRQLEANFLDLIRAIPIEKSLVQIMVYSAIESHRKRALTIFRRLVVAFDNSGRYKILLSLLSQPQQHSGLQGLVISIYKDFMFTSDLFLGQHLHRMLKSAIKSSLPEQVASDLLEQNDTIFATLNLIRYICLKDSRSTNETKLWDLMPYIGDNLLKPLHKALDLSRAHYKLELCKLKEQKTSGSVDKSGKNSVNFEVKIGGARNGGVLPNIPIEQKHQIVLLALQNFDLIESILVRVEEIINE
ncbi:glomulin-like [Oppia nitens]|uniref:glomulin-like n=1 Tax=Oppia nitens TaxID=1686743 RepID=UPI0023DB0BAB|nr:glomulin-like [Oppia nitens]